jgi:hypothetical protein
LIIALSFAHGRAAENAAVAADRAADRLPLDPRGPSPMPLNCRTNRKSAEVYTKP